MWNLGAGRTRQPTGRSVGCEVGRGSPAPLEGRGGEGDSEMELAFFFLILPTSIPLYEGDIDGRTVAVGPRSPCQHAARYALLAVCTVVVGVGRRRRRRLVGWLAAAAVVLSPQSTHGTARGEGGRRGRRNHMAAEGEGRESRLMRPKGSGGETAQRHCFFLWHRPVLPGGIFRHFMDIILYNRQRDCKIV